MMFCNMVQSYVSSINKGSIPDIQNAWEFIVESECIKAFNDCLDIYNQGLKKTFQSDQSRDPQELSVALRDLRDKASAAFFFMVGRQMGMNEGVYKYHRKLSNFMTKKEDIAWGINKSM